MVDKMIYVNEKRHRQAKIAAAKKEVTLKEYTEELIQADNE